MFPDFKRELDFDVEIKAVSVLIGVQEDTVHLHRVIESHVSSDGRLILQQTPLGCTIIGVSGDRSTQARYVNLIRTLRDDEMSYDKTNALRQHEDCSSSYDNNNKACDTGQPPQSSPAFAGPLLTTRRRSLRDTLQLHPRPHERTLRAFRFARQCPSVFAHFSSSRDDAQLLLSNLETYELGFSYNMDEEIDLDDIKEEIQRLHLASQASGMDSATERDIDERLRRLDRILREESARQDETLERLRADQQRTLERTRRYQEASTNLMQVFVEAYNRVHPPPPPDDKKT